MAFLALFSVVLLVYCTGVCASQESDLVVLTTASRLREEIKSQLDETELCTCQPQNCSSFHEDLVASIETRVTDSVKAAVSQTVEDLLLSRFVHPITPGYIPSHPATSCKDILDKTPGAPSGLYWIRGTDNAAKHMYCDMERICKNVTGGWMRVASIDMTNASSTCPSGLRTLNSPRRLCAMNTESRGCSSAVLPVQGVQYSRVCGKIIGYQDKTPDAFYQSPNDQINMTIDSDYVDGISLTHGTSPRIHIWTFAAAVHEYNSHPSSQSVPVLTHATLHLLQYLTL